MLMKNVGKEARCRAQTLNIGDRKGISMDHQYSVVKYLLLYYRLIIDHLSLIEKDIRMMRDI
jgi:hypothetical protein